MTPVMTNITGFVQDVVEVVTHPRITAAGDNRLSAEGDQRVTVPGLLITFGRITTNGDSRITAQGDQRISNG